MIETRRWSLKLYVKIGAESVNMDVQHEICSFINGEAAVYPAGGTLTKITLITSKTFNHSLVVTKNLKVAQHACRESHPRESP